MKIKEKASNFMEEHGGELIVCGGMILAYAVGLTVGAKITTLQFNAGISNIIREKPEIEGMMLDAMKNLTEKKKNKGLGSVETLGLFFFMKGETNETT